MMVALVAVLVIGGMLQMRSEWSASPNDDIQSLIPTPTQLAEAWQTHRAEIMGVYLPNTLRVTLIGLAIAITLGLLLATLMDFFPLLRWTLYPVLIISQTVPTFAIAVILILLFGFGDAPKIIVVVLFCFFAVATNTLDGFRSIDQTDIDLIRTMGASPLEIWWKVRLPAALPNFFSGVRLATTYSVVGAVIGEYVGSGEGLGKFLQRSYRSFQTDQVFLAVAIIATMSIILVTLVTVTEMLTLRWRYAGKSIHFFQFLRIPKIVSAPIPKRTQLHEH